ncbi:MAG: nitroreductase family protein [Bacilli bacterium]|jgi:nitroreductase|nr:nitroreductase family protein [Bacilli bacterium]
METLKCIEGRQSVRKYVEAEIPQKDVDAILKAGLEAPSAMNRRPYELVVNVDNAFWRGFAKAKPTCDIAAEAALSVLVVGDSNKNPTPEFMIEDCSNVSQNILLAAYDLGYGSLWCGIKFGSDFYKELISYFKLPDGYMPVSLLIIGKAGERNVAQDRDRFEKAKIHYGRF